MIFRSILRLIFNSFSKFWFLTIPWPFLGIFGRFSGIFCVWMGYRSHIFYLWSLELYQEISYEIFIFDHIWGEGAGIGKLATGDFCARSGPPQLGAVLVFTCNYLNYLLLFSWTLRICLYMISWNVGIPAQISLFFLLQKSFKAHLAGQLLNL